MSNQVPRPIQPPVMRRRRLPDTDHLARQGVHAVPQMATQRRGSGRNRRRNGVSSPELILWIGFGGAALVVLAVIAFFSLFVLFTLSDRILPGVVVGETSIGGMSIDKASEALWADWNENTRLIITDGTHYWQDIPGQFGLYLDSTSTAEKAYEIGRGTEGLSQFFGLLKRGKDYVAPEVVVNMEAARAKLELYAEIIDVPATDAALKYTDGEWSAMPGITGVALDIPHTLAELVTQRSLVMSSGYFSFTLMPVLPQFEDVSAALEKLQPILDRSMRFEAYDPITNETTKWTVDPQTFASWVRIENLDGDPNLTVDQSALSAYLQEWQNQLGAGRTLQEGYYVADIVNAWKADKRYAFIVWHPASTYKIQPGDMLTEIAYRARMPYWKIIEANPGIDPEKLIAGEDLVIPSQNEMLPEPIVKNKRIVISITSQRMWTYENGSLLKEYVISTGVDESPTLPGIYQIQTHELEAYASVWDLYMPHFMGIYQGWPGFWNGIHGLPTLSSGVRLWASVLGRKASYGCIIMDLASAETVYNWADTGVVVEIQP
jgi:lipoprotein-anchoring transpeptidase ErfK/SrfK